MAMHRWLVLMRQVNCSPVVVSSPRWPEVTKCPDLTHKQTKGERHLFWECRKTGVFRYVSDLVCRERDLPPKHGRETMSE